MREMMPSFSGKKELLDQDKMSLEERKQELWDCFESQSKVMTAISRDYAPWHWNIDEDYYPNQLIYRERGATGFEHDPILKQIFLDLEYLIEEVWGE